MLAWIRYYVSIKSIFKLVFRHMVDLINFIVYTMYIILTWMREEGGSAWLRLAA